jgi:hypothetical protein
VRLLAIGSRSDMRSFGSESTSMCLRLSDTESLVMGAVGGHVLTWTSANRTHCLPRLLRGGKSLARAGNWLIILEKFIPMVRPQASWSQRELLRFRNS